MKSLLENESKKRKKQMNATGKYMSSIPKKERVAIMEAALSQQIY
jgi:hypothetical protein